MNTQDEILPLVDSHCHLNRLDLSLFDENLTHALDAARKVGVQHFLTVSVELEDVHELKIIASSHPDVSYSVGWHPTSVLVRDISSWLLEQGAAKQCLALGETGLDYYHLEQSQSKDVQQALLRQHIAAARQLKKPLIIHTRQSADDTMDILKQEKAYDVGGVMHCFTEDWATAKRALDLGFMISMSGIVTFKNAKIVHEVAQKTPMDRLLIETDSPYLAPVPFRGKSNHPQLVRYVAMTIASLRGLSAVEVAQTTTDNFKRMFLGHSLNA